MENAIGFKPLVAWIGRDLVCILEREDQVINAQPDLEIVKALDGLLLHITSKGARTKRTDKGIHLSVRFADTTDMLTWLLR